MYARALSRYPDPSLLEIGSRMYARRAKGDGLVVDGRLGLSRRWTAKMRMGFIALGLVVPGLAGCPYVSDLPAPGRVEERCEPVGQRPYYLYVPTSYHDDKQWPLVVACHGTRPYDTAEGQLDEWKGLAEKRGFLLAVPELKGTRGDLAPPVDKQIELQRGDEAAILSMVRAIRVSRSVHPSRIFLTGWSAGGYAVLFTGLRNPDVFRALAIRQGNFDARYVEPCVPFLDRHQPIQIMYADMDLLRDQALACVDWLRSHDLEPVVLERPGAHRREPGPIFSFFVDVVRKRPWVRVHARDDSTDPMRVKFRVRTSFEPTRYLWDFGDGSDRSPLSAPEHTFVEPGLYTVRVAVWPPKGRPQARHIVLQVPRPRLGSTAPQ